MLDLSQKIRNAEKSVQANSRVGSNFGLRKGGKDIQLEKVVRDSNKIAGEEITGLLAGEVKAKLFNGVGSAARGEAQT